jgi:DNA-directed RNA polymerase specialized sigma24 family protein
LTKVKDKKELTQEKFANFLAWLNPDSDLAGEEYERLRFRLTTFFSHRNSRFPEELADETINRVSFKFSELIIENKLAFCYGVAKNVFLESLRKEKDFVNIDDVQVVEKKVDNEFDGRCLDKCLGELSSENRTLVLDYFSENKSAKITLRERLSENLGITQTNLRMKIVRIKKMLKSCLLECASS